MDTRQDELKKDLDAAVQVRKELGPEYEREIVDSFLTRLDARLDAQVERRVAERLADAGYGERRPGPQGRGGWERPAGRRMGLFSLIMAIPLSAIASDQAGLAGLMVAWAGIVGVNVASSLAERRADRERRADERRRRDGWE